MKKRQRILVIAIVLTLAFIWGNSLIDKEHSARESGFVMNLLTPILELVVGKGNVTEHLVRKLAHFCEFALLGAELEWFFCIRCSKTDSETLTRGAFLLAVTHGMFSAVADETIQIFSGRGSQLKDVLLDSSGALFGALFALIVLTVVLKNKV